MYLKNQNQSHKEDKKEEAESDTKDTQYVGDFIKGEYHKLDCKLILKIDDKNWIWFSSVAKATGTGFKPCKTCVPPTSESRRTSFPKSRLWFGTVPKVLGWVLVAFLIVLAISSLVLLGVYGLVGGLPVITFLIIMLVVWLIRQYKLGR